MKIRMFMFALLCLYGVRSSAQSPITGTPAVCATTTTTLSNVDAGGNWISDNTTVATINSSGIVTGVTPGTSTISYTVPGISNVTQIVTVNAMPTPITGITTICLGSTSTLASSPSGGTWSSSNSDIAVGSLTGIISSTVSATTATITYTRNGCSTSTTAIKSATAPTITPADGIQGVCINSTKLYTASVPGGTWSVQNGNISMTSSGQVTGITQAISTLTYTLTGACRKTQGVTIYGLPNISSTTTAICFSPTTTLAGGSGNEWTSSNSSVISVDQIGSSQAAITGLSSGTAIITYKLTTTLCQVTRTITVNPSAAAISGTRTVCVGNTTALGNPGAGGTWTSSNTEIATIDVSTGVVTGISQGTATITYILTGTPCTPTTTTAVVTVNPNPTAITGSTPVDIGASITLSNTTSGGTWSSGTPGVATVDASGIVTGISPGTTIVSYTLSTGCYATVLVTVNEMPITGEGDLCIESTSTLSSGTGGGTWSSGNPGVATIGATTGIITGISSGTAVMTYTIGTYFTTTVIGVHPKPELPATASFCYGGSTTLNVTHPSTGAFNWSYVGLHMPLSAVALDPPITAASAGVKYSAATGTDIIQYKAYNNPACTTYTYVSDLNNAAYSFESSPAKDPLADNFEVCVGSSIALSLSSGTPDGEFHLAGTTPYASEASITTGGVFTATSIVADWEMVPIAYERSGCWAYTQVLIKSCPLKPENNHGSNLQASSYHISPNPSNGNITISGARSEKTVDVRVTNYVGATVYAGQLNMALGEGNLKLNNLAEGMYIVELRDDNGYTGTHKIVIEK